MRVVSAELMELPLETFPLCAAFFARSTIRFLRKPIILKEKATKIVILVLMAAALHNHVRVENAEQRHRKKKEKKS